MDEWRVDIRRGLGFGIALMVFIFFVDVGLIWLVADRRLVSLGTFVAGLALLVSLVALGLLGYWCAGLADSGYFLDRNMLVIRWGALEQTIPMGQIEQALDGAEVTGQVRFSGGAWPGHYVGYGESSELGQMLFYSTAPPQRQILVVTPGLTYGISPADHEEFLKALRRRMEMGPTQIVEQSSKRPRFLSWGIWQDRVGLALVGSSLVAVLALVALLAFRFPSLPRMIPLHFSSAGAPDRIGVRGNIFIIPLIGLLAAVANGMLGWWANRRDRVASYLLWGGALLVQVLVWGAAVGILAQT